MKLQNLHDLYMHELQDLYSAEQQILKALPAMIEKAESKELKESLADHLEKTEEHAHIVKRIASEGGFSADAEKCKGMEGLITEGTHLISLAAESDVRDAAIIIAAQRIEHYEISGYGSAIAHARELGLSDAAYQMEGILEQEYEADTILSEIALSNINEEAMEPEQMYT